MKRGPKWVSLRAVVAIHEILLAEHGGASGLLDEGLLRSALDAPKNQFAYGDSDLFRLAASYAYALTQNRPFVDGNKRVSLTVAASFLELNGIRLSAPEAEAVEAMLALSSGRLDTAQYATWLRGACLAVAAPPMPPGAKPRSKRKIAKRK